jgi:hypothetical protein
MPRNPLAPFVVQPPLAQFAFQSFFSHVLVCRGSLAQRASPGDQDNPPGAGLGIARWFIVSWFLQLIPSRLWFWRLMDYQVFKIDLDFRLDALLSNPDVFQTRQNRYRGAAECDFL